MPNNNLSFKHCASQNLVFIKQIVHIIYQLNLFCTSVHFCREGIQQFDKFYKSMKYQSIHKQQFDYSSNEDGSDDRELIEFLNRSKSELVFSAAMDIKSDFRSSTAFAGIGTKLPFNAFESIYRMPRVDDELILNTRQPETHCSIVTCQDLQTIV